ncbi:MULTISPECIES: DUF6932 family protein [Nostoc]|uniref:Uncharacterized protein n=1 Tax=Nostoc paludosum FACHB-159 TaxID=2692908 RepID=A0ABR8KJK6_9NOSO|nr:MULTISPECIES: hypothetical protein [Nostoc]MBD2682547.1 hypothetical protein [Nostoc sp. FACHB-857]MBD2738879.1 hypothetical protein [Nostoc paludosum FACHB-159]
MIPEFEENGNLPPGVHWAEWEEFQEIFGTNLTRQRMVDGLELAMTQLKAAGCSTIYIDGSFVTSKQKPGDFDACWEDNGVDINYLQSIAPALFNFALRRAEQKIKYKGEIFPSNYPANDSGTTYIDFFQFDTRTNTRKGIIAIDLQRWKP